MKQYVCKKKANFGGERYFVDDVVPAEKIDPSRVKQLIDYGILSVVVVPDPFVEPTKESEESAGEQQQEDAAPELSKDPDELPPMDPVHPEGGTDEVDDKAADEKPTGKRKKQ